MTRRHTQRSALLTRRTPAGSNLQPGITRQASGQHLRALGGSASGSISSASHLLLSCELSELDQIHALRHRVSVIAQTCPQESTLGPTPIPSCQNDLERLRHEAPQELLTYLSSDTSALPDHLLTFAAELAGDLDSQYADATRSALLQLLEHPRAYVREGAIYGLSKLPPTTKVRSALRQRLAESTEPSAAVREAAEDALDAMD